MTASDPADRLDRQHIRNAAAWAAEQLALTGQARVRLTPGDMTEYPIQVTAPSPTWWAQGVADGKTYWVVLCCGFGTGYEWMGGEIHADYAAQKWTHHREPVGTRIHGGAAVAAFLTALCAATRCRLGGHEPGKLLDAFEFHEVRLCQRCGIEYVEADDGTTAEVEG